MVSDPAAVQAVWTMATVSTVIALKHYAADFVLQSNWVARGKEKPEGWFFPLAIHVLTHAAITLAIALVIAPRLWWLAAVDFVIHFAIDRAKTPISRWGGWQVSDEKFWWLIGADQFLHQATNIGLAAAFLLL